MAKQAKHRYKNAAYVKPVPFDSMSASARRVAVAKDVIAGLKSKRLKSQHCYLFTKGTVTLNGGEDLQTILATKVRQCEVCGIGAIFVAAVEKFDRVTCERGSILQFGSDEVIAAKLKGLFSPKQLQLIEAVYEGYTHKHPYHLSNKIYAFSYRFPDSENRMVAIMRNIIRNNGVFKL